MSGGTEKIQNVSLQNTPLRNKFILTVIDGELDDLNCFSAERVPHSIAFGAAVNLQVLWWNFVGTSRVVVAVTFVATDCVAYRKNESIFNGICLSKINDESLREHESAYRA